MWRAQRPPRRAAGRFDPLDSRPPTARGLPEGAPFDAQQVVLEIEGPFSVLACAETALLGVLALSGAAGHMRRLVKAAGGRPVYDMSARHYPPSATPLVACAAKLGGASGTSTEVGAAAARVYPHGNREFNPHAIGTIPHALSAVMPRGSRAVFLDPSARREPRRFIAPASLPEVRAAEIYARRFPDRPLIVLHDFSGREIEAALEACRRLGRLPNFWGFRLDTAAERSMQGVRPAAGASLELRWLEGPGVSVRAAQTMRAALDQAGWTSAKLMLSSGFTAEKAAFFVTRGAPFDALGTGSFVEFAMFTADIVAVRASGRWRRRVKAGREWLAAAKPKGLVEWRW
jgi:nicotinate phosphoribosyltransferase